jgi:G:T-mismatch repair DNA endonuclease (very short patch repair protein)
LIIAIINLFQHLKHIQSASIEKVTRTKTIPKFQLRKILNSSEFPMFSGRKNGSSEVDIALQKYNIQVITHAEN